MSGLTLSLLGPPRIELNGQPIQVNTRKAVALLAYLAVTDASHSRDALATLFWPESDQPHARGALRVTLSVLKKALGEEWLEIERESVALKGRSRLWLDADHFDRRLAECRTHGHPPDQVCLACLAPLSEAVALYRDDFLSGFSLRDSPGFEDWRLFQAEYLRYELASALEKLVRYYSAQGEFKLAITYTQRWLSLDPLHEPAHRRLIQLYVWSGQRTTALRQYEECVQILERELGVTPQEETIRLCQAIRENNTPSPSIPTISTQSPTWWHARYLPSPSYTQLFGVKKMLSQLLERLEAPHDHWLVSVEGMGGLGKTAVAREVAGCLAKTERFAGIAWTAAKQECYTQLDVKPANGVHFTFENVLDAVTDQLDEGDLSRLPACAKQDHVRALLKARPYLVVVDNLETATDYGTLPNQLWELAGPTKFLLTSRHKVGPCNGLSTLPLGEMAEPDGLSLLRYEGYRRGMRELAEADDKVLHPILAVTGGNPLAIKLVISQLAHLPLDQVLSALQTVRPVAVPFYRYLYRTSWNPLSPGAKQLLVNTVLLLDDGGDWDDLLAVSGLHAADLSSAIAELTAHSLLQARGLTEKSYHVHCLTRHFILSQFSQQPTFQAYAQRAAG